MLKIIIVLLIIGVFFLQKVGNHQQLLKSPYDKAYHVFNTIFGFIHGHLRKYIKPLNIGRGLDIDIVPFISLIILLILLMFNSTSSIARY